MRAKNQTKSAVLMNLEQRIVSVEDIGRQVCTLKCPFAAVPRTLRRLQFRLMDGRYSRMGSGTPPLMSVRTSTRYATSLSSLACRYERCNGVSGGLLRLLRSLH